MIVPSEGVCYNTCMLDQLDFLSIGDITVDDFIKLKDAHTHDQKGEAVTELCVPFGDKIEYESRTLIPAVANSANAAVCAARLGLRTAFLTDAGNDNWGRLCKQTLEKDRVITNHLRLHDGIPTNYHYVLWYKTERTILVKHQEYPYKFPKLSRHPKWIYLSSIGEHSLGYHREIARYLAIHPDVKLAFQPGTFQMRFGTDLLASLYHRAQVFFCNVEEAQRILKTKNRDIKFLLQQMHALGPELVVVTNGRDGAYAYNGSAGWFMPIYPGELYERTGAGDAFSATFTAALALGKTIAEALRWVPVNAASVVKYIGAQEGLLDRKTLEKHLEKAPADYRPRKIL